MDVKGCISKQLEDLGHGLARYLEGLGPEEVAWAPAAGAACITEHLFHAARFEDEFVRLRIMGLPELWDFRAGGGDESAVPPHPEVLTYFERVRAGTLACVSSLSEVDLDRPASIPQGQVTVAEVLTIVIGHFAQHLGAITYLRRLQRGPAGVEHE